MDNWTGQLLSCSREVGGQGGDVYARLSFSACLRFEATVSLSSLLWESHILQLFVGASCSRAGWQAVNGRPCCAAAACRVESNLQQPLLVSTARRHEGPPVCARATECTCLRLYFFLSQIFFFKLVLMFRLCSHSSLVWNNWIELRDGDAGGLWKNVRLQEGTCVCVCLCCHVKHHPHLLHLVRPLLLSSLTVINDPQLSGTLSSSFLFFCFFFSFWLPARDGGTTLQWIRKIKRVKEAVILSLQNREDLSQATRCWKE